MSAAWRQGPDLRIPEIQSGTAEHGWGRWRSRGHGRDYGRCRGHRNNRHERGPPCWPGRSGRGGHSPGRMEPRLACEGRRRVRMVMRPERDPRAQDDHPRHGQLRGWVVDQLGQKGAGRVMDRNVVRGFRPPMRIGRRGDQVPRPPDRGDQSVGVIADFPHSLLPGWEQASCDHAGISGSGTMEVGTGV